MRERIAATRWADDWDNADWQYGVEAGWLRDMAAYWADGFDWRAQEAAINRWPQFVAEIDGYRIYFLHVRGKGPNPHPPDPDARVAMDFLGLARADWPADRSGRAWR